MTIEFIISFYKFIINLFCTHLNFAQPVRDINRKIFFLSKYEVEKHI